MMIPATYDDLIRVAMEEHLPCLDWRLYKAQLWQESRFDANALSPAGAEGVAQFMPKTWTQWAKVAGFSGAKRTDVEAAVFTGACYMSDLYGQWSRPRPQMDRVCLALISYNCGLGNVLKAQKVMGDLALYSEIAPGLREVIPNTYREPIDYTKKILGFYDSLLVRGH